MNLNCRLADYRISSKTKVRLAKRPTQTKVLYQSKAHYREMLAEYRVDINRLQNILFAHNRYALLLIFQGMDTSGKDGAIKHVMSGVNPQSCQVFSFKQPGHEELAHDFLWRTNKRLPERGKIGIFNRSYYEEVLIARVNPEVLAAQRIPSEFAQPKQIWKERFSDIVNLEDYLHRNGTHVIKFFLHLSKAEQKKRLLARIDEPKKNWKLTPADFEVRRQWAAFQKAYEECLSATSTRHAPWYVIPADDKLNARLIISKIIVEAMKTLRMKYPVAAKKHRRELETLRRLLKREK
jgi:PPK2 family polyphosphate:nucleotide phosphotransferase